MNPGETENNSAVQNAEETSQNQFEEIVDPSLERESSNDESEEEEIGEEGGDNAENQADDKNSGNDDSNKADDKDSRVEYPAELLKRAESLGYTPEEIAEFGTPEKATRFLELAERRVATKSEEKAEETTVQEDEIEKLLDPEVYDPNLIKAFKGLQSQHKAELKSLRDEINLERVSSAEKEFDTEFSALGKNWESLFGTGKTSKLNTSSEEMKNRLSLIQKVNVLATGYSTSGQQVPELKELIEEALQSKFSKHIESLSQKKIVASLDKRKKQFSVRPSDKDGKPLNGTQRAVQAAAEFMSENPEEFGSSSSFE